MATEVMTAPEGRIIHKTYAVLSGTAIPQRVHVTQYDESLPVIACTLYKDGQLYTIPDGASVRLRMNKNGLPIYHEAIGIDDARHVVYLEITAQMTVLYGEFAMVLEVETSDGKTAGTSYLRLIVRQNPVQNPELDNIPDYTANSNRLTAEGVKKLQDESSTQQKAIEDKGKNTLESIPADYSTLSGKVDKNTSGISELKEDIAFVSDERISPSMTNFVVDGRQLFNKDGKLINGYYNNGKFVERSDMGGHFIKIKGGSNICASGAFFYGATFDANRKLIKEYLNVADGSHITIEKNAAWLYVATSTQLLDQLVVSYGDDDGNPVGNYWDRTFYVDGKYIDGVTSHTIYKLPYIQNCRVKCNGGNDTVTAYYAGVDCKKTVNIIQCRWIWERGSNTGTLALIINPNGIRYIKDITASSLHLQVRNNQIKLDVLGVKYGNYYYQNIIDKTLDTIMPLDNKTEHIVSLVAIGNECIVTLDGTEYKGTFIPDDKITSLNEILGQYATFEHFCQGKRGSYAMPQITQFIVRANDEYIIDDDFQRQDGQLQNTPQGISYHLISTLSNRG